MIINIANFLTFLRLATIPFLVISIINKDFSLAFLLFTLGAITDSLDGFFARRFNLVTVFGSYFDPLVDKLFLISCYISLTFVFSIPKYFLILMLVKETILIFGGIYILLKDKTVLIKPTFWGKLTTFLNITFIWYLFISLFLNIRSNLMVELGSALITVFMVITLIQYIFIFYKKVQSS